MTMRKLFDTLRGKQRMTVQENERALVLHKGRFIDVFGPGQHLLPLRDVVVERHDLARPELVSAYERQLFSERPDWAAEHLTVVQAGADEVAVAFRDGKVYGASSSPQQRAVLWAAAGPWDVQRIPLTERLEVPAWLLPHLEGDVGRGVVVKAEVTRGHVGLLTVGGRAKGLLEEGLHLFWKTARPVSVKLIDVRRRVYDVAGQEVLTADRVTVRVNIAAQVQVVDPETAATAVENYDEALHRALQLAFRKTVGQRTLDQLLGERVSVDVEAADAVRTAMAEIGLEVGEIALKDVILPGEMREILNRVVEAEKTAEANVIRRREETAATRALLNTAKVMEENPVMLRLKELEALTELAGKVERLTVHNGTAGLMNDLVRLRD